MFPSCLSTLPALYPITCSTLPDCTAGGCACSPMAQAAVGSGPWGSIDAVMNVQVSSFLYFFSSFLPMTSHASEDTATMNYKPYAVYCTYLADNNVYL